jgi:hypothetical protein
MKGIINSDDRRHRNAATQIAPFRAAGSRLMQQSRARGSFGGEGGTRPEAVSALVCAAPGGAGRDTAGGRLLGFC